MHPATQLIAMSLQKGSVDGKDKSITLQLDPPELGRVNVKMTFGKDKTVKAIITVEKPETFAMLNRDTHSLERAMNAIGLDADGSINFELSQDGQDFNQDGNHDGSRNHAFSKDGEAEQMEMTLIQNSTLYVDPETGLVRCNMMV